MDSDPTNNRLRNLRALCQRCHMLHDRQHHLVQRWLTYRRRLAIGDLFLGSYPAWITARLADWGAHEHPQWSEVWGARYDASPRSAQIEY
jgi:hypothetical protein